MSEKYYIGYNDLMDVLYPYLAELEIIAITARCKTKVQPLTLRLLQEISKMAAEASSDVAPVYITTTTDHDGDTLIIDSKGDKHWKSEIITCRECLRYRPFGNGYGECRKQNAASTVKDGDYCSQAIRTDRFPDEHKYSGLTDE